MSDIVKELETVVGSAIAARAIHEIESLSQQVVTSFDLDEVPQFRQGIPKHELEEVVTAERCAWFVGELIALRQRVAELENMIESFEQTTESDRLRIVELSGRLNAQDLAVAVAASVKSIPVVRELRQRVAELENNLNTARVVGEYRHELVVKLEAELSAIKHPAPIPVGWQPIDTAPWETEVLVTGQSGYIKPHDKFMVNAYRVMDWHQGAFNDATGTHLSERGWEPTHWMPLPAAPKPEEG